MNAIPEKVLRGKWHQIAAWVVLGHDGKSFSKSDLELSITDLEEAKKIISGKEDENIKKLEAIAIPIDMPFNKSRISESRKKLEGELELPRLEISKFTDTSEAHDVEISCNKNGVTINGVFLCTKDFEEWRKGNISLFNYLRLFFGTTIIHKIKKIFAKKS